jgi:peptidoglycan/LPS O-acetylase OafA/YrhL
MVGFLLEIVAGVLSAGAGSKGKSPAASENASLSAIGVAITVIVGLAVLGVAAIVWDTAGLLAKIILVALEVLVCLLVFLEIAVLVRNRSGRRGFPIAPKGPNRP